MYVQYIQCTLCVIKKKMDVYMEKGLEVNLYSLKMHVNIALDMKEYFLQIKFKNAKCLYK